MRQVARHALLILLCTALLVPLLPHARAAGPQLPGIPRIPTCEEDPAAVACQVPHEWDLGTLADLEYETGQVWAEDGILYAVFKGAFDTVILWGGVITALDQIPGTGTWGIAARVQGLERARITFVFLPLIEGRVIDTDQGRITVRGADAPPAPPHADPLAGTLATHSLTSDHLAHPRNVTVYVSPNAESAPELVITMPDGQAVMDFAPFIEPHIIDGTLPPLLLIGTHAAGSAEALNSRDNPREAEYLADLNDPRYLAHEQWFIEDMIPWAEATYNAPTDRAQRVLFGFSNGANFIISAALRHPDLAATLIPFSVGGWLPALPDDYDPEPATNWYFASGTLEPDFNTITAEWVALLTDANTSGSTERVEYVSGHESIMWQEELPAALLFFFGAN